MGDETPTEATTSEPGPPSVGGARVAGFWLGAAVVGLALGLLLTFAAERLSGQGKVLRGVVLDGRSLGGSDEPALRKWASGQAQVVNQKPLELVVGERSFQVRPSELGVEIDVAATTERALAAGRMGGLGSQLGFWFGRLFAKHELTFVVKRDAAKFEKKTAELQGAALLLPIEPGVFFDGELRALYPEPFSTIDRPAFAAVVDSHLARAAQGAGLQVPLIATEPQITRAAVEAKLAQARQLARAPLVLVSADGVERLHFSPALLASAVRTRVDGSPSQLLLELSLEALAPVLGPIKKRLEKPAHPAGFDVDAQGAISVVPSATGFRIDEGVLLSELFRAAQSSERQGLLPLRVEQPVGLTETEAAGLGVRGLVAQFATRHPCCEARVKNIHSVAAQIDGYVLRPGDTFSLNQFLGPRTGEGGYVEAPTIVRGKMKATAGGGISQFATTLFNAVFDGGYEIVQRQPHSFYFSRYPEGLEATVSFPSPDLIFKNDTKSGLLIKTRYDATSIRVLIYGDNEGRRVERRVSARSHIVQPPLEYEPNADLLPDESKLVTRGQVGWSVMTLRILHYADGSNAEQGREVVYQPKPHIVQVHPCRIPKGMKAYTGETCPEPEEPPEEPLGEETLASESEAPAQLLPELQNKP